MRQSTDVKLDALALAVARGLAVSEAARDLRINVHTAQHMSQRPEFWPRVAEHRKAIVQMTAGHLAEAGVSAAMKLTALLSEAYPPDVQFKAAKELLSAYLNLVSQAELAERLDAIEKRLSAPGAGGQP